VEFRKVFVVEPVHDTSVFKKYTSNVTFLLRGDERAIDMQERIRENLSEFNPEQDAFISMGRTTACIIAGLEISRFVGAGSKVKLGIFQGEGDYIFIEVET